MAISRPGRGPHRIRDIVVVTLLILTIGASAIILVGAWTGPDGKHLLGDPGVVLVAFLGALATAAGILYPFILKLETSVESTQKDARLVREQVENGHVENPNKTTNIRVDLDQKPDRDEVKVIVAEAVTTLTGHLDHTMDMFMTGVFQNFRQLGSQVEGQATDIHGLRGDVTRNADATAAVAERLQRNERRLAVIDERTAVVSQVKQTVDTMAVSLGVDPNEPPEETPEGEQDHE